MTLIAVTAHHCPFRNLRNQTPNKPLPQHNTSNEAATMRDDEYARRYYDDLTEAKKTNNHYSRGRNRPRSNRRNNWLCGSGADIPFDIQSSNKSFMAYY
jgi:hypothetical protein